MNKEIKNIIENRQTVKEYSDKKISDDNWNQIKEMIRWSPSSHGLDPYRVLVIKKENPLRKILKPLMWNQGTVENADKLIFFLSLSGEAVKDFEWQKNAWSKRFKILTDLSDERIEEIANKNTKHTIEAHLNLQEVEDQWPMKQTYIALGNALSAATILGIGSSPMEGFQRKEVQDLFLSKGLMNSNERLAVVAAFGYPKDKTSYAHRGTGKRDKRSLNEIFTEV